MFVFYCDEMVVDQIPDYKGFKSPSAKKPQAVAEAVKELGVQLVRPVPLTIDDFKLAHDPAYVEGVLDLTLANGFGTRSKEINDSLPFTNGAMYSAAIWATPESPTAALVSGFHHAGWKGQNGGLFCTFNGLMIAAMKFVQVGKKVAILDCDMHWGDGTDDILKHRSTGESRRILHISFGAVFKARKDSVMYLDALKEHGPVEQRMSQFQPDVLLYQAGADVHVDDPAGGLLTTEEMIERDHLVFTMAKKLKIPIAFNLAGGYQIDANGSFQKVVDLHLNTFKTCLEVYR